MIHPAAADMCSSSFEATAIQTSVVALFSQGEADRLQATCRGLGAITSLLRAAGAARRSERMLRVVQGRAEERVAFLLLELALRTDRATALAREPCTLHLSQRAIGEMTGLSSVHVCRVVNRIGQRGTLRAQRGRIELLDLADLSALACVEPEALAHAILV